MKSRVALNIDQEYLVGNSILTLPPEHLLCSYQKSYQQYDKFLPHLAKYLDENSIVIDVGANVGDTVGAMAVSNDGLRYVCVEADDGFFDYLVRNIKKIKQSNPNVEIDAYKRLIGLTVSGVKLVGEGGTKHAAKVDGSEDLDSTTLDALVSEMGFENISLIKSDVDGYDYDVIDSAQNAISKGDCLLYFECQYDGEEQFDGYKNCLNRISLLGYDRFAIFDNFGGLIISLVDKKSVIEFMNYVRKQNDGDSARTIHYFDVLAYKRTHDSLVSSVLSDY